MAFKMKGPMFFKSALKNYKNPQDYKIFNMGNKPTPFEQSEGDLKEWLVSEKGFTPKDADWQMKNGSYDVTNKSFLNWYKGKDEPAEPKGGKEDVMEEGRTPMNLTSAERAENLARWAEKGKDDPNYWKKVKEVTGVDKAKYKGKTY